MTDNRSKEQSASPDAAAPPGITGTADSSGVGALTSNQEVADLLRIAAQLEEPNGWEAGARTVRWAAREIERLTSHNVDLYGQQSRLGFERDALRAALQAFVAFQIGDHFRQADAAKRYCEIRREAVKILGGRPAVETNGVAAAPSHEVIEIRQDYRVQCRCGWMGHVSQLKSLPEFKMGCPDCSAEFVPIDKMTFPVPAVETSERPSAHVAVEAAISTSKDPNAKWDDSSAQKENEKWMGSVNETLRSR